MKRKSIFFLIPFLIEFLIIAPISYGNLIEKQRLNSSQLSEFFLEYDKGHYAEAFKIGQKFYEENFNKDSQNSGRNPFFLEDIIHHKAWFLLPTYFVLLPYDIATLIDAGGVPSGKMVKNDLAGFDRYLSKREQRDFFYKMGAAAQHQNRYENAYFYYKRVVTLEEQFRLTLSLENRRVGYMRNYENVITKLVEVAFKLDRPEDALTYMELGKARTMCDILNSGVLPEMHQEDIRKNKMQKASLEYTLKKQTLSEADLESIQRAVEAVMTSFDERRPSRSFVMRNMNAGLFNPKHFDLKNNAVAIDYFSTKDVLYMVALKRNGVAGYASSDIENKDLSQMIEELKNAIRKNDLHLTKAIGGKLHRICFKPLEASIRDSEILIISPNGPLQKLPFYALFNDQFLCEKFSVLYVFSLNMYNIVKDAHEDNSGDIEKCVLIGDPSVTNFQLPGLPWARRETEEIEKILVEKANVESFTGPRATESQVFKCPDCDVIHFAAHSFFDTESPENSFIALASSDRDGLLHASELYGAHFENGLQLVVMSSCDSGRLSIRSGGDAYGLIRSWFIAGAKQVVSTFWPVADQDACHLMVSFYRKYAERGLSKPFLCLREAIRDRVSKGSLNALAFKIDGVM